MSGKLMHPRWPVTAPRTDLAQAAAPSTPATSCLGRFLTGATDRRPRNRKLCAAAVVITPTMPTGSGGAAVAKFSGCAPPVVLTTAGHLGASIWGTAGHAVFSTGVAIGVGTRAVAATNSPGSRPLGIAALRLRPAHGPIRELGADPADAAVACRALATHARAGAIGLTDLPRLAAVATRVDGIARVGHGITCLTDRVAAGGTGAGTAVDRLAAAVRDRAAAAFAGLRGGLRDAAVARARVATRLALPTVAALAFATLAAVSRDGLLVPPGEDGASDGQGRQEAQQPAPSVRCGERFGERIEADRVHGQASVSRAKSGGGGQLPIRRSPTSSCIGIARSIQEIRLNVQRGERLRPDSTGAASHVGYSPGSVHAVANPAIAGTVGTGPRSEVGQNTHGAFRRRAPLPEASAPRPRPGIRPPSSGAGSSHLAPRIEPPDGG